MLEEHIARINELSRIARERELTEAETAERATLRAAYLENFRSNFKDTIEHTKVQYPDGTKIPFKDAYQKPKK